MRPRGLGTQGQRRRDRRGRRRAQRRIDEREAPLLVWHDGARTIHGWNGSEHGVGAVSEAARVEGAIALRSLFFGIGFFPRAPVAASYQRMCKRSR